MSTLAIALGVASKTIAKRSHACTPTAVAAMQQQAEEMNQLDLQLDLSCQPSANLSFDWLPLPEQAAMDAYAEVRMHNAMDAWASPVSSEASRSVSSTPPPANPLQNAPSPALYQLPPAHMALEETSQPIESPTELLEPLTELLEQPTELPTNAMPMELVELRTQQLTALPTEPIESPNELDFELPSGQSQLSARCEPCAPKRTPSAPSDAVHARPESDSCYPYALVRKKRTRMRGAVCVWCVVGALQREAEWPVLSTRGGVRSGTGGHMGGDEADWEHNMKRTPALWAALAQRIAPAHRLREPELFYRELAGAFVETQLRRLRGAGQVGRRELMAQVRSAKQHKTARLAAQIRAAYQ